MLIVVFSGSSIVPRFSSISKIQGRVSVDSSTGRCIMHMIISSEVVHVKFEHRGR